MFTSAEVLVQTLHAISQTIWVTIALTLGAFAISLIAGSLSVMLQLAVARSAPSSVEPMSVSCAGPP